MKKVDGRIVLDKCWVNNESMRCLACGKVLPSYEFTYSGRGSSHWSSKCKACETHRIRLVHLKNRIKAGGLQKELDSIAADERKVAERSFGGVPCSASEK